MENTSIVKMDALQTTSQWNNHEENDLKENNLEQVAS